MKRTIAAFVLCLLVGFGFRYALNLAETARLKTAVGVDFAPFQVESAIAYAQVRSIAAGREDAGVLATATTADLSAAEQLSGGMETFLGWSLALKRWVTGSPVIAADHAVYEDNPGDAA